MPVIAPQRKFTVTLNEDQWENLIDLLARGEDDCGIYEDAPSEQVRDQLNAQIEEAAGIKPRCAPHRCVYGMGINCTRCGNPIPY
jgi:hypothetical protein